MSSNEKWQIRRIYDQPARSDGFRVLVDRLWPRGVSKEKADLDEWPKQVAPSDELRKWFHADPEKRHAEFVQRFTDELDHNDAATELAEQLADKKTVTLLTAAKDPQDSHVPVLKDWLSRRG